MGRFMSDGSFKPKPSTSAREAFMQQEPQPLRSVAKGTEVFVRMGAGWNKGKVVSWSKTCITAYCPQARRNVNVFDNRSIRLPGDPKW